VTFALSQEVVKTSENIGKLQSCGRVRAMMT